MGFRFTGGFGLVGRRGAVVAVALGVAVLLGGCKGGGGEDGGGGDQTAAERLLGKWVMDAERMVGEMGKRDPKLAARIGGDAAERARLVALVAGTSIAFSKEGMTMAQGGRTVKFKTSVVSEDGDKVVLERTQAGKDETEKLYLKVGKDSLYGYRLDGDTKVGEVWLQRPKE